MQALHKFWKINQKSEPSSSILIVGSYAAPNNEKIFQKY